MLTHIDLFSGIGGFSLAAQWAGFRTICFCEIDEYCRAVLKKHWPGVLIVPEIRDFKWREICNYFGGLENANAEVITKEQVGMCRIARDIIKNEITLLTGGPPCQRTSMAAAIQGKRTGETLWPEMAGIVQDMRPNWIIVEQPPGNKTWENQVKISLEGIGYRVARFKRQASDCGAPHPRKRLFIVANAGSERLLALTGVRKTSAPEKISWPSPPRGAWRSARTGNSRVDDGLPNWVDRLKALGNAIVPQVAYEILKGIAEIENETPCGRP